MADKTNSKLNINLKNPFVLAALALFVLTGFWGYLIATGKEAPDLVPITSTPDPAFSIDVVSPTIEFSSGVVPKNSYLTLRAKALDNKGIQTVEFFINGKLKCTDTTKVYSCTFKTSQYGGYKYLVEMKAHDTSGNTASSSINFVTAL